MNQKTRIIAAMETKIVVTVCVLPLCNIIHCRPSWSWCATWKNARAHTPKPLCIRAIISWIFVFPPPPAPLSYTAAFILPFIQHSLCLCVCGCLCTETQSSISIICRAVLWLRNTIKSSKPHSLFLCHLFLSAGTTTQRSQTEDHMLVVHLAQQKK